LICCIRRSLTDLDLLNTRCELARRLDATGRLQMRTMVGDFPPLVLTLPMLQQGH
jgi:hypothetical protein